MRRSHTSSVILLASAVEQRAVRHPEAEAGELRELVPHLFHHGFRRLQVTTVPAQLAGVVVLVGASFPYFHFPADSAQHRLGPLRVSGRIRASEVVDQFAGCCGRSAAHVGTAQHLLTCGLRATPGAMGGTRMLRRRNTSRGMAPELITRLALAKGYRDRATRRGPCLT